MSLSLPLSVRLSTGNADRHVTRDLRDLQFRSTAPGGFASCTLSLDRPLDSQPSEIDYYGEVYVYDRRNGQTVWEGRLEDPGRTAGDGEIWTVTAVGGAAHAQDRMVPLIYIDQSISDGWTQADKAGGPHVDTAVGGDPGATTAQAIVITFQQGRTLAANDRGVWRYNRITDAGQKLARFDYTADCYATNASFAVQGFTRSSATAARSQTFNVAGLAASPKVVVTDFTNGDDILDVRGIYTGAGVTPGQAVWCSVRNVFILAMRKDATGTDITTGYTTNSVLASDVVADLLGRLLPKFDGANASITPTAYTIDSLAYPEGVTPATLLDDLMILEPAYYWAAWESNTAGLYRFEWTQWPTSVRYEATTYDGFDSPGSAADLYNAVRVRYIDVNGKLKTLQRTQTVTALDNAGLTREGFLDLTVSQGRHSLGYAQRTGDEWLAERASPPNAGTLTVARPIRDLTTGALVQPWEIKPGQLIRVRGVLPRVDALNATARDGVTVFKIAAVDFQASNASARLELDSYPRSVAAALAKLSKRR